MNLLLLVPGFASFCLAMVCYQFEEPKAANYLMGVATGFSVSSILTSLL